MTFVNSSARSIGMSRTFLPALRGVAHGFAAGGHLRTFNKQEADPSMTVRFLQRVTQYARGKRHQPEKTF
jgi:hypothetical protein